MSARAGVGLIAGWNGSPRLRWRSARLVRWLTWRLRRLRAGGRGVGRADAALLEHGGEALPLPAPATLGGAAQHRGMQPVCDGGQLGELAGEDCLALIGVGGRCAVASRRRGAAGHGRSLVGVVGCGGPGPVRGLALGLPPDLRADRRRNGPAVVPPRLPSAGGWTLGGADASAGARCATEREAGGFLVMALAGTAWPVKRGGERCPRRHKPGERTPRLGVRAGAATGGTSESARRAPPSPGVP